MILTAGRSGSTLLVDLLNANSEIHCEGEILATHAAGFDAVAALETYVREKNCTHFGFKAKRFHFENCFHLNLNTVLDTLAQNGWTFVYVYRRNLVDIAVSKFYAEGRGKYFNYSHEKKPSAPSIEFDADTFIGFLEYIDEYNQNDRSSIQNYPHLSICYEEDLLDNSQHTDTLKKIYQFLGIKKRLYRKKIYTTKIVPEDRSEIIRNWADIKKRVQATKYREFLTDEM